MTQLAKVFQSGNSQAVRLPKQFRLDVEHVEISREGDALILRPHHEPKAAWACLRAAIERGVSDDFMADGRLQPDDAEIRDLDAIFP